MNQQQLLELAERYGRGGHSAFGPSSSHMWLKCSGSLIPNLLAKDDGNAEAAYGTVAHEVSEVWLRTGKRPKHLLGTTMFVEHGEWGSLIAIDEEMMHYVQMSVNQCILRPGHHIVEERVNFSRLTPIPNQGGTLDFAALSGDHALVIDHKYGKGVRVDAKNNSQAMLYALGLLYQWDWEYDFKKFTLRIHQPRLDHFDEWECTRDELMEFAGFVKARAAAAWKLNAPRTPDPKACQFCKVRTTCAANIQMQMKLMADQTAVAFEETSHDDLVAFKASLTDDFDRFSPKAVDPVTLGTEELVALKPYRKMVEGWWKSMDHELLRRAIDNERIPGYKLVEGRSHRQYVDVKKAGQTLTSAGLKTKDVFVESIISPSEAEKALIKAGYKRKDLPSLLEGLIFKPKGKPTLAPLSDKRPELTDVSDVSWDDETDETDD